MNETRFTIFDTECQCEILPIDSDGFVLPDEQEQLDEFLDCLGGGSYFVYHRPADMRITKITPRPDWSMTLVFKDN